MSGFFEAPKGLVTWNPSSTARTLGLAVDVVRDFGASGSMAENQGSISAGSSTLVLVTPGDFRTGQGIAIEGAGPGGAVLVTTILGGAGTSVLTLATAAETGVTNALVLHDDSWAWQAAIDAATVPTVVTCPPGSTMNIAAGLVLRSDVVLALGCSTLVWIGPQGGTIFTSPVGAPLLRSGVTGGRVGPGQAGHVFDLHSPQDCSFDLEVLDGTTALTVMRWAADAANPGPVETCCATGNVVYRLTAGTCGTLLSLSGQQSALVTQNLFVRLEGGDCHVAGVVCEESGYVRTNLFLKTHLVLAADNAIGVSLGESDQAPEIGNLVFVDLSLTNPTGKSCTGLYLHSAGQVQVLSFAHDEFPPGTAVNGGGAASFYIRDAGQDSSAPLQDTTKGWSVAPLQISPKGTPITNHISSYQLIQATSIPPETGISTSAQVPGVRLGDTVVATPGGLMPIGAAWNALAISDGVVALFMSNPSPVPLPVGQMHWRFDIWQH